VSRDRGTADVSRLRRTLGTGDLVAAQEEMDGVCRTVAREAEEHTEVLTVENTGEVDDAVDAVVSAIE